MMGAGGAMMLWRLAWYRAFPEDRSDPPYTPSLAPMARNEATSRNKGSWEYHRLLQAINLLSPRASYLHLDPVIYVGKHK